MIIKQTKGGVKEKTITTSQLSKTQLEKCNTCKHLQSEMKPTSPTNYIYIYTCTYFKIFGCDHYEKFQL